MSDVRAARSSGLSTATSDNSKKFLHEIKLASAHGQRLPVAVIFAAFVARLAASDARLPVHTSCNPAKIATIATAVFSLFAGTFARQQAPQHDSRNATHKKLEKYRHAD